VRCIKNQGRACASDCVIIKEKYLLFMRRLLPGVKIILFLAFGFLIGLGIRAGLSWFDPTAAPPALNSPPPINVSDSVQIKEGGLNIATVSGNVGVGTTTPASLLSVGSSSQFQVDSSGNLVRINNIPYSWPSFQGGGDTFLQNDGAGNLSWAIDSSSYGAANLLFTRSTILTTSTAAQKDALCGAPTEFGPNYVAASELEVTVYASMGLPLTTLDFSVVDDSNSARLFANTVSDFNHVAGSGSGNRPLACVKKNAPIRFTRTYLVSDVNLPTRDSQCIEEFGSQYHTASVRDLAGNATLGTTSTNYFITTEISSSFDFAFRLYADTPSAGFNFISKYDLFAGLPVACIRKI